MQIRNSLPPKALRAASAKLHWIYGLARIDAARVNLTRAGPVGWKRRRVCRVRERYSARLENPSLLGRVIHVAYARQRLGRIPLRIVRREYPQFTAARGMERRRLRPMAEEFVSRPVEHRAHKAMVAKRTETPHPLDVSARSHSGRNGDPSASALARWQAFGVRGRMSSATYLGCDRKR